MDATLPDLAPRGRRAGRSSWCSALIDLVFPPQCVGCAAALDDGASIQLCLSCREEIDPAMVARERDLMTAQVAEMGKPAAVIQKIIEGKLEKWYADNALMEQPFVKDPDRKISDVVSGVIAKLGENIQVRRFVRMALGETQS